jgi:hypothetical protein
MIVIANNMKEACQYLEEKKARNRANRINAVNIDGLCKSFNSNDYKQIKTKMKSSFGAKAKAHSRSGYWNHYHLTLTEIKDKY